MVYKILVRKLGRSILDFCAKQFLLGFEKSFCLCMWPSWKLLCQLIICNIRSLWYWFIYSLPVCFGQRARRSNFKLSKRNRIPSFCNFEQRFHFCWTLILFFSITVFGLTSSNVESTKYRIQFQQRSLNNLLFFLLQKLWHCKFIICDVFIFVACRNNFWHCLEVATIPFSADFSTDSWEFSQIG